MTAGSPSAVRAAIAVAAVQLGLDDPAQLARDLLEVDIDALDEWFTVAARARVRLWQGAGRLTDCVPQLSAGWSSSAPLVSITNQRDAGLASRDVVGPQVDAADRAGAVLRQGRVLADAELNTADATVIGLGWPPGQDLLIWAAAADRMPAVTAAILALLERLSGLRSRNNDALADLAGALRGDPRDPVELLTRSGTAGSPVPGSGITGPPTSGTAAPAPPSARAWVDANNLVRLRSDLLSDNPSTVAMASGVAAALEKARTEGGDAQLLVYESANTTSQGRAAISVGDISTADNVAVLVPGITSAPLAMTGGIDSALALRSATGAQSPGDATAVVAWFGYDIPLSWVNGVPVTPLSGAVNSAAALSDRNARVGGGLLVDDLAVMKQLAPSSARFVGIGFSMGSTTVSAAAARGGDFDDLVLMGSPGASNDVSTADDYPEVPAEHTYVVSFDQDPVTEDGVDLFAGLIGAVIPPATNAFGPDPAAADFRAQVVDVVSNAPEVTPSLPGGWFPLSPTALAADVLDTAVHHNESNYLSGASLAAVAAVTAGHYSEVPIKPGR